jgi:hypothetical protein
MARETPLSLDGRILHPKKPVVNRQFAKNAVHGPRDFCQLPD